LDFKINGILLEVGREGFPPLMLEVKQGFPPLMLEVKRQVLGLGEVKQTLPVAL
jgi:hypothetical protein